MTAPSYTDADIATARFVDNKELRRRLAPTMGWDRFLAWVHALEARGFPTINKECGLRDFRKVERWLDSPAGIEADARIEDGPEYFDNAPPYRSSRTKARPGAAERDAAILLDGKSCRARSDGLS